MDVALFWSIFVVLGIAYFAIAIGASRSIDSTDEYFYAGRRLGAIPLGVSLIATHIGGAMIMGTVEESYRYGFLGGLYNLGIICGFLVLSLGFAYRLHKIKINTTAEIFKICYQSANLQKIASLLSIITLGGLLTSQILATRILFNYLLGQYHWVLILFWLLLILYTMFGGIKAVIATDFFQLFIIFVVFTILSVSVCKNLYSDNNISEIFSSIIKQQINFENIDYSRALTLFLLPFLYTFIAQDLGQRFFSARQSWVANMIACGAGLGIALFALIPVILGMQARLSGVLVNNKTSLLIEFVQQNSGIFLFYLTICALIAAISSTADSLLCAISSNIFGDFFVTKPGYNIDNFVAVLLARIITLVVGVFSLVLAYNINSIFGVLTISYEISVSVLFVPIFFSFFMRSGRAEAAGFAMFFGFAGFCIFRLYPLDMPKEILALLLSSFGFFVGLIYSKIFVDNKNGK